MHWVAYAWGEHMLDKSVTHVKDRRQCRAAELACACQKAWPAHQTISHSMTDSRQAVSASVLTALLSHMLCTAQRLHASTATVPARLLRIAWSSGQEGWYRQQLGSTGEADAAAACRIQLPPGANLRNVSPARRVAAEYGKAASLQLYVPSVHGPALPCTSFQTLNQPRPAHLNPGSGLTEIACVHITDGGIKPLEGRPVSLVAA